MNQKALFILCGEAFAGKPTIAKKLSEKFGAKIVGRDAIYFATKDILALGNTPDEDDHRFWDNLWPVVLQGTKNHLLLGNSVIIDDNCFFREQRKELRTVAEACGANLVLIYLDVPAEILKKRKKENKITKTRHDVPSRWLAEDAELFERPTADEKPLIYTPSISFDEFIQQELLLFGCRD